MDAVQDYEAIVHERPSYRRIFNLLLCYHTLGQRDKTRRAFTDLLKIQFVNTDDDFQPTASQSMLPLEYADMIVFI
jgi:hypothetical protein